MNTTNIFWFRRDLRLEDNAGLYHALKNSKNVVPIFIFDADIIDILNDRQDKRVNFIYQTIQHLKKKLNELKSDIAVYYGKPIEIFEQLTQNYHLEKVFTNHDYESYGIERDASIQRFLATKNIELLTFKDHVIFEKQEILTDAKKPYSVYTPYSRKWKAKLNDYYLKSYPTEKYFEHFLDKQKFLNKELISLEQMNFKPISVDFPLDKFDLNIIEKYEEQRNFPAIKGTTYLGIHLRFGTISIRKLAKIAQKHNAGFLNELIWRDFYMMVLSNFPHVANNSFKPNYDKIEWRNDKIEFEKWCQGQTGYPIVDAGMRELNATGYMHNRVRMIVASFLTKHLLIDWRWGEAYFAEKLLDFDKSANNGGWQWAASSGCDAVPYFRIFNPTAQAEKFDKQLIYIKKWIPELSSFNYPKPIVEHTFARNRCLETYKKYIG